MHSIRSLSPTVVAIASVVTAAQARVIAVAAVSLARAAPVAAQDAGKPLVIGQTITLRSKILNEDRRINVRLPDRYEQYPSEGYPVLYQLDGGAPGPFYYLAGLVDYLSEGAGRIPHMIVVGIPNTDRTRDLSIPLTVTPPIFQK